MTFILWIAVVAALALVWSLWGRDWLKGKGWWWSEAFFRWLEPIEIRLWKNSKTIFKARLQMATGLLLTFGTQIGAIDITPIMPFVPDKWEPVVRAVWNLLPLTLTMLGWMDERLRAQTTLPLEIVALPENKPPEVAAAVAKVEAVNTAAVQVVEVAKAEGSV